MSALEKIKLIAAGTPIIREWIGSGGEVVHPMEADWRAKICLACPKHNPKQDALVFTGVLIREILAAKNDIGLTLEDDAKLGTCDVCGCVMKLQVWETKELLAKHTEKEKYPTHCWKINT